MLQQTQMATVLPYYRNFLRCFPSIEALAKAPLHRVLAAWAGLGYYTRAKNMHLAARIVMKKFGGRFPDDWESVLALPGIGRYTAGAVLSIAFGQRYAVVDGNVERVLARLLKIRANLKTSKIQKRLWTVAELLVPAEAPSKFNQGLMEFGALVCLPKNPQCGRCPLTAWCGARRHGIETEIPSPRQRQRTRDIQRLVAVIRDRNDRILLSQRRETTLMRNFWEFPSWEFKRGKPPTSIETRQSTCRLEGALEQIFTIPLKVRGAICTFRHHITFHRIHVQVFEVQLQNEASLRPSIPPGMRWIPKNSLNKFLFDSASLKILESLHDSAG